MNPATLVMAAVAGIGCVETSPLFQLMAATNVRKITSWTARRQQMNSDSAAPAKPKRARRREVTRGYSLLDREEQAQAPPPSA